MFQKDEKVKVKSDLKAEKIYGTLSVNDEMKEYRGKELTVVEVLLDKFVRVKETLAVWDIEMLEKTEDKRDIKKRIYSLPLLEQDINTIVFSLMISGIRNPDTDKRNKLFDLSLKICRIMRKLTEEEK